MPKRSAKARVAWPNEASRMASLGSTNFLWDSVWTFNLRGCVAKALVLEQSLVRVRSEKVRYCSVAAGPSDSPARSRVTLRPGGVIYVQGLHKSIESAFQNVAAATERVHRVRRSSRPSATLLRRSQQLPQLMSSSAPLASVRGWTGVRET